MSIVLEREGGRGRREGRKEREGKEVFEAYFYVYATLHSFVKVLLINQASKDLKGVQLHTCKFTPLVVRLKAKQMFKVGIEISKKQTTKAVKTMDFLAHRCTILCTSI